MAWQQLFQNPRPRDSIISRRTLTAMPYFSIVRGSHGLSIQTRRFPEAMGRAPWWGLFETETPDETVLTIARRRGFRVGLNPEAFIEETHHWNPRPDDWDAALEYLSRGGSLVKLPDTLMSPYYRFYTADSRKVELQLTKY